jgi:hypothetical protein
VRRGGRNELLTEGWIIKRNPPDGAWSRECITSNMPRRKSSKTELVYRFLPRGVNRTLTGATWSHEYFYA